jgi:segregation and condensation protein B
MDQKKLIEAALFMTQKPLDLHDLAKITGMSSLGFLKESLEALKKEYEGRGVVIAEIGGRWQMQVKSELLPAVASLTPHQDLPEGPKRSLALILYKEPVKQSEIIKIQGNKAYAYIKALKKKGLVKAEKRGHTKILSVTKELENYFGMKKDKIKEQLAAQETGTETENSTKEKEQPGLE